MLIGCGGKSQEKKRSTVTFNSVDRGSRERAEFLKGQRVSLKREKRQKRSASPLFGRSHENNNNTYVA